MQRLLANSRYQPIVVRTVAAAKRALDRVAPAAVLLDVVLFGDEFWRMILGLRQGEATADIPIVVTSSTGEKRKALHLGADADPGKPIEPDVLFDVLDRLTGNQPITKVLIVDDDEVTRYLVRQLLPRGVYDLRVGYDRNRGIGSTTQQPPRYFVVGFEDAQRPFRAA